MIKKRVNSFISEEKLRKDIDFMVKTAKEVLLKNFGKNIVGIYFKGSASKKWDSHIDYVPELSDVDIHILFKNQKYYLQTNLAQILIHTPLNKF